MEIIEYRKHLVNGVITNPEWVVHGGYFHDRDTDTYLGLVLSSSDRGYYIPDTVVSMTLEEAIQRVLDIHNTYPWLSHKDEDHNKIYKTEEEVTAWVTKVFEEKPDPADMY